MRRSPLFLILLLCRATPSVAQQTGPVYAGCYRIIQGEWDSRLRPGAHPSPDDLPHSIQLDTVPLTGWPLKNLEGARLARSISSPGKRSFEFTFWQPLNDDSIFVARPMPFSGFYMKVTGAGSRMEGRVTSFTDLLSEDSPSEVSAPVVLDRVDCATALPGP